MNSQKGKEPWSMMVKTEVLEERIGGIEKAFGQSVKEIKLVMDIFEGSMPKVQVTKDKGLIIDIVNKFSLINPMSTKSNQ